MDLFRWLCMYDILKWWQQYISIQLPMRFNRFWSHLEYRICAPPFNISHFSFLVYRMRHGKKIYFLFTVHWNGLLFLCIILINTESTPLHWCHSKMLEIISSVWLWIAKVEIDFNFKFLNECMGILNVKVKTKNHMRCKLLK